MFLPSPVSVGILPSNRTLEVGVSHLTGAVLWMVVTLEQFPVADDPFTDFVPSLGEV